MKHSKFMIAGVLALALTACTSDTGTADTTEDTTVSVTESAAEESTTTTAEAVIDEEAEPEDNSSDDYIAKIDAIFADYSSALLEINLQQAENEGKDYDTVLKLFNEYKDEGYEAWQAAWNETCPDVNPGFIWGSDYLYTIDKWGIIDLENDEHLAFAERTIINPAIAGSVVTLFDADAQSAVFELQITFNQESRADAEYIVVDTDNGRVIYYLWENYRGNTHYMKYVQQADGTYISENEFSDYPEDDTEIIEARSNNLVTNKRSWGSEYDFMNPVFTIPPIAEGSTAVNDDVTVEDDTVEAEELSFYKAAMPEATSEEIEKNESIIKEVGTIPKSSGLKTCDLSNTDKDAFDELCYQHAIVPGHEDDIIWIWTNKVFFTVNDTDYLYLPSTTINTDMLYNLTSMQEYSLTRVSEGYCAITGDENGVYLVRSTEGLLWVGKAVFDLTKGELIYSNTLSYDRPEEEHSNSDEMKYYMELAPYVVFDLDTY